MAAKVFDIFTGKLQRNQRRNQIRRRKMRANRNRVIDEMVDQCREFGDPDLELFMEIHDDVADDVLAMTDILAIYLMRKKLASYRRD